MESQTSDFNTRKEFYQSTFDNLLEGFQIIDFDYRYFYLNKSAEFHSRRPAGSLLGQTFNDSWPGIENTTLYQNIKQCLELRNASRMENRFEYPDGTVGWFHLSIQPVPEGVMILSYDITSRVEAERQLAQMKRLYSTLSQVNHLVIRVRDRDALFSGICQVAVRHGEFSAAWIGILDEGSGEIVPCAAEGLDLQHWPFREINIGKGDLKDTITAMAVQSSSVITSHRFPQSLMKEEARAIFKDHLFRCAAAVPLRQGEAIVGVLTLISSESGFLQSQEESQLLQEMGTDISFALDAIESERVKQQWANAFEHCGYGIAIGNDAVPMILYCNSAFASMHGGTIEEICSRPVFSYYFPDDHAYVRSKLLEAQENGSVVFEARKLKIDGSIFNVEMNIVNVCDREGKLSYRVVTQKDITEQKKAEARLVDSENRYRLLAENVTDLIWILDIESHSYDYVSPSVVRLRGFTAEEVMALDFSAALTPESARWFNELLPQRIREFIKGNELPHVDEIDQPCKDGTIVHTETTTRIIRDPETGRLKVYGVTRDIAERKKMESALLESEERFRKAFFTSPEAIGINRLSDGCYVSVNQSFTKMTGYTEQDVGGKTSMDIGIWVDRADRDRLIEGLQKNEVVRNYACRFRLKNGEIRDGEMSASIIELNGIPHIISHTLDITDRKKATEELKASEEKFRSLIESSVSAITTVDKDGYIRYANQMAAAPFGKKADDIIGKRIDEIFPPALAMAHLEKVREVMEKNKGGWFDAYLEFPDLSVHWFHTVLQPVTGNGGKVILVMVNAHEITGKKIAEQEVKRMGRYYQTLIDKAPDGFVMISTEGKFSFISPAARRILGYSPDDFVPDDPGAFTHPDDLPMVVSELSKIFTEQDYSPTLQYRFLHKNGTWRWIESTFSNLVADPDVHAVLINFRDIHERKNTESALMETQALFAGTFRFSPVSITITDLGTSVWLEVNDAFLKMTGYSRNEVVGKTFEDLNLYVIQEDRRKMVRTLLKKGHLVNQETEIQMKNGSRATVLISMEKLELSGRPCILTMANDITDRKIAEAEIHKLNQELEDRVARRTEELETANQEMEAFTYSVSHDLRAPLRGINGFIRIMMEDYAGVMGDEGIRLGNMISENAMKMATLIDDLLNFSRLGRGGMTVGMVDMRKMARETFSEVCDGQSDKMIEFILEDIPNARADHAMLRQVWMNLLSNAVKYSSPREKPVISVSGCIDGDEAVYHIHDNGVGFNMHYKDKLFGVFQRLHSPKNFSGTGVGLAIVHRVINRHGGRVWAEGEEDKGATFHFALPVR